jgi:hypothetical protein
MHVLNKRMEVRTLLQTLSQPIIKSWGVQFQTTEQVGLEQWYSTFFVRVPPDIISLQLCTPKVVGVQFKLYIVYLIYIEKKLQPK